MSEQLKTENTDQMRSRHLHTDENYMTKLWLKVIYLTYLFVLMLYVSSFYFKEKDQYSMADCEHKEMARTSEVGTASKWGAARSGVEDNDINDDTSVSWEFV